MSSKILVVDDEKIIRESISYILKKEGYEVEEAENGKVAYNILRERSFDLVITDLYKAKLPQACKKVFTSLFLCVIVIL